MTSKPVMSNSRFSTPDAQQVTDAPKSLLSVEGAARFALVSETTVRRWIKLNELPHYRAGKQIRIAPEDLLKFLSNGSSRTAL